MIVNWKNDWFHQYRDYFKKVTSSFDCKISALELLIVSTNLFPNWDFTLISAYFKIKFCGTIPWLWMILSFPSPCLEGTGQFQFCHMSAPTERPTGAYGPNLLLHLLITQGFGVQGGFSSYSPSLLTGGASCALTSSCQDLKVRRIALSMLYQSDKFSWFIKEGLIWKYLEHLLSY